MKTNWITNGRGQSFLIDAEDKYMARCLQGKGYQMRNWHFTQQLVPPGGTAIDCGASIGMNTVNYAEYFDRVEAFEPDPDIYECLLETVAANGCDGVYTHPVALSNHSETRTLIKFPRATFANTLHPIGYRGQSRPQIPVQCARLDDYELDQVSFMKIDVEGWEMAVLEGAENTITTHSPVIQVEIKPQMLKRSGTTPQQVLDWFAQRSYSMTHWQGTPKSITVQSHRMVDDATGKNLVDFWFVPKKLTPFDRLFE